MGDESLFLKGYLSHLSVIFFTIFATGSLAKNCLIQISVYIETSKRTQQRSQQASKWPNRRKNRHDNTPGIYLQAKYKFKLNLNIEGKIIKRVDHANSLGL